LRGGVLLFAIQPFLSHKGENACKHKGERGLMEGILQKFSNFVLGLFERVAENIWSGSFLINVLVAIVFAILFWTTVVFLMTLKAKYLDEWWNKKVSRPESWIRRNQHFIVGLAWGFFLLIFLGPLLKWQTILIWIGGIWLYVIGHGAGKRGY
jgi:hypothetical protein